MDTARKQRETDTLNDRSFCFMLGYQQQLENFNVKKIEEEYLSIYSKLNQHIQSLKQTFETTRRESAVIALDVSSPSTVNNGQQNKAKGSNQIDKYLQYLFILIITKKNFN